MAITGDRGGPAAFARELERRAEAVRSLPGAAAVALAAVSAAQLGAGVSPYGEPWPPRRDGVRALAGAQAHVRVEARGNAVVASLDARGEHHQSRRPMIPTEARGLPLAWSVELERIAGEALR